MTQKHFKILAAIPFIVFFIFLQFHRHNELEAELSSVESNIESKVDDIESNVDEIENKLNLQNNYQWRFR